MSSSRSLLFVIVVIVSACGSISAQRRWERLPPPRDPQFYVPRNKLEDIDGRMETLLIKGRHWVGTVRAQNGSARVEAYEVKDSRTSDRATGVLGGAGHSNGYGVAELDNRVGADLEQMPVESRDPSPVGRVDVRHRRGRGVDREGEERALPPRLHVGSLRRSTRAPPEGNLLGQRQPDWSPWCLR